MSIFDSYSRWFHTCWNTWNHVVFPFAGKQNDRAPFGTLAKVAERNCWWPQGTIAACGTCHHLDVMMIINYHDDSCLIHDDSYGFMMSLKMSDFSRAWLGRSFLGLDTWSVVRSASAASSSLREDPSNATLVAKAMAQCQEMSCCKCRRLWNATGAKLQRLHAITTVLCNKFEVNFDSVDYQKMPKKTHCENSESHQIPENHMNNAISTQYEDHATHLQTIASPSRLTSYIESMTSIPFVFWGLVAATARLRDDVRGSTLWCFGVHGNSHLTTT